MIIFKKYSSMIEFEESDKCVENMICFYFNDKINEDILVIIYHLQNTNQQKIQTFMFALLLHDFNLYIFVGVLLSFFETFYQRMHDFEKKINSSCGRISDPHIFGNFTCISFRYMYIFSFFLISDSLKLGSRMSNYNNNKSYIYNDAL